MLRNVSAGNATPMPNAPNAKLKIFFLQLSPCMAKGHITVDDILNIQAANWITEVNLYPLQ